MIITLSSGPLAAPKPKVKNHLNDSNRQLRSASGSTKGSVRNSGRASAQPKTTVKDSETKGAASDEDLAVYDSEDD
jgi:hypothetical protein